MVPQAAVAAAAGAAAQTAAHLGASPTAVADAVAMAVHSCWRWSAPRPELCSDPVVECEIDKVDLWLADNELGPEPASAAKLSSTRHHDGERTVVHKELGNLLQGYKLEGCGCALQREAAARRGCEEPGGAARHTAPDDTGCLKPSMLPMEVRNAEGAAATQQAGTASAAEAGYSKENVQQKELEKDLEDPGVNLGKFRGDTFPDKMVKPEQERKPHEAAEACDNTEAAQQKEPEKDLKGAEVHPHELRGEVLGGEVELHQEWFAMAGKDEERARAEARAEWLRLVALEPLHRPAGARAEERSEAWRSLGRAQPRSGGRGKVAGRRRGRAAPGAPD